jgi:cytochrome c-type biogenesis protein CcmH
MGKNFSNISATRPESIGPVHIVALLAILAAIAAVACSRDDGLTDLQRRAYEINQAVMCPVCPGESIDQSQNPLAVSMRGIVYDRLQQGWTEQQIKDHFVESYGDSVLLAPPAEGFNLIIWVLPPVGITGAIGVLFFALRAMRRGRESGEILDNIELTDEEYETYAERIERALSDERAS